MEDLFNLERFIEAQEFTYSKAISELKKGKKTGHWISFIFPQIIDLGNSPISKKFALKSKKEALAFYKHPILGNRLLIVCKILLDLEGKSAFNIFGHPDYLKVRSCITLFLLSVKEDVIFEKILDKYFDSRKDDMTLMILSTL